MNSEPPQQCEFVQVAIPTPLHQVFDYKWRGNAPVHPGTRVKVPFGRRNVVGIVVRGIESSSFPANKLRSVTEVLDDQPLVATDIFSLLTWASRYYHHPIGDVLTSALPVLLRRGNAAQLAERETYRLANSNNQTNPISLKRAPLQHAAMQMLLDAKGEAIDSTTLASLSPRWRTAIKPLQEKALVLGETSLALPKNTAVESGPELVPEQQQAVTAITDALGSFTPFLLNGVTGSGKTEVYLCCIEAALKRGDQVLILVPEISLTPQLMRRFQRRINGCLVSLHSALNDTERMQNWLLAANGHADVVIGTRSAVLVPLPRLGLLVIDEEHDSSLKQQDGFRYHARDLALVRARDRACPVVMGTATPSFETLNNASTGRYTELQLTYRAGNAKPPIMSLLDIRRRPLIEGMSDRLFDAIRQHLDAGNQSLVFINRRGYAPTLLCNDCGACADCRRCDAHMTVHNTRARLRCHHCGSERAVPNACETCGSENLDRVGYGTERIAAALADAFPDVTIARIDRDSTRRKGSLQQQLEVATSGEAKLLVGTQMLAKGHHFPGVTLVCVLDADRGLFGTDFRSLEQMGQLIIQVAGRSGREKRQGTVLIQTRNPDNEMMQTLVSDGYAVFAKRALEDRQMAMLPPYAFVALVRAEAPDANSPLRFLRGVAQRLSSPAVPGVHILGPVPAPMERLGGRYRAQLLLQAERRSLLNECLLRLTTNLDTLKDAQKTRWSIDVDPVDLF
jgi:primosomal protein N' (replication factor Y)